MSHIVTFAVSPEAKPLLTLDLGEPAPNPADGHDQYLDAGDLAQSGGNLYLTINGKEYGSLFFQHDPNTGNAVVTLGAYNPKMMDWQEKSELRAPVPADDEAVGA